MIHVHDFVDVELDVDDDDDKETLLVSVVIGVFDGQCTQEVERRKSVGNDLD